MLSPILGSHKAAVSKSEITGKGKHRRALVDQLAYCAARERGGDDVTAVLLEDGHDAETGEEELTVWVASNVKRKANVLLIESVFEILMDIAHRAVDEGNEQIVLEEAMTGLLDIVLPHNRLRNEAYFQTIRNTQFEGRLEAIRREARLRGQ